MGWDNERYSRTKKDTLHLSFVSFGISHSRFSDIGISNLIWDIPGISQKPQKIPLGYPATGHIPGVSQRYPMDIPK
jgi:hypothetical protein